MKKLLIIIIFFSSCSSPIRGIVTRVSRDTVTVNNHLFLVKKVPAVGDTVTFDKTSNRKKVNSKRL